jgi:hypothetical protein
MVSVLPQGAVEVASRRSIINSYEYRSCGIGALDNAVAIAAGVKTNSR